MKAKGIVKIFSIVLLLFFNNIWSQHSEEESHHSEEEHHHSMKGSHRLSLGLGHTHLAEGSENGKKEWVVVPSWSFNYDYWISNKWAIGLQNDIVLESFIIENENNELIERSFPWAMVPVGIFKPGKHLSIVAGVGAEFTSEETLGLTRLGIEYGWHLPKDWELGGEFAWDAKWNYYNSWGIAIVVSKIFK